MKHTEDLILLTLAIRARGWRAILLRPQSKKPLSRQAHWQVTAETRVIQDHVTAGGNVGLIGYRLMIVDFDVSEAMTEMFDKLGPLPLTVRTGSGKHHSYLAGDESLPAKIRWRGATVGEIQRHTGQYVVCPPSVHPDTGERYVWLSDPTEELPSLPPAWREYLTRLPAHVTEGDTRGQAPEEPWRGPPPEELIRRALRQPGAVRRAAGVKFQCPECLKEGHDKHQDNALVRNDGRWGCAFAPNDPKHRQAIAVILKLHLEADMFDMSEVFVREMNTRKIVNVGAEEAKELRDIDVDNVDWVKKLREEEGGG